MAFWAPCDEIKVRNRLVRGDGFYPDLTTARRPNQSQKRVNVDFPAWTIESLDREASRLGVTQQLIIKVWLAERLEGSALNKAKQGTH